MTASIDGGDGTNTTSAAADAIGQGAALALTITGGVDADAATIDLGSIGKNADISADVKLGDGDNSFNWSSDVIGRTARST